MSKVDGAKMVNVEIAPGNQSRMDTYIQEYNRRPDRRTPKVKYTDVVNEALDRYLSRHFGENGTAEQEQGGTHGEEE